MQKIELLWNRKGPNGGESDVLSLPDARSGGTIAKAYAPWLTPDAVAEYWRIQSVVSRSIGEITLRLNNDAVIDGRASREACFRILDTGGATIASVTDLTNRRVSAVAYPERAKGTVLGSVASGGFADTAQALRTLFGGVLREDIPKSVFEELDRIEAHLRGMPTVTVGEERYRIGADSPEIAGAGHALLERAVVEFFRALVGKSLTGALKEKNAKTDDLLPYVSGRWCIHYDFQNGRHTFTMVDLCNSITGFFKALRTGNPVRTGTLSPERPPHHPGAAEPEVRAVW